MSGFRGMWEGEKQLAGEGSLWKKQKGDLKRLPGPFSWFLKHRSQKCFEVTLWWP